MEPPRDGSDIGKDRKNSSGSLEKSVLSSAIEKSWRRKSSKINLMIVNKHNYASPVVPMLPNLSFHSLYPAKSSVPTLALTWQNA